MGSYSAKNEKHLFCSKLKLWFPVNVLVQIQFRICESVFAKFVFRLARLGDAISRELISSGTGVEKLHEYLAENGETLEQASILSIRI